MRIHTNTLTVADLTAAAKAAGADLYTSSRHGSRSRSYAYEVALRGSSRRRPMGGGTDGFAATWDQWGIFLAVLFEADQSLTIPRVYVDGDAFATATADRFGAPEVVMTSKGYADEFKAYGTPEDAHGDHTFRFSGTPGLQQCTKCSAVTRWNF